MVQASIRSFQSALLGMVLSKFTVKAREAVLSVPVEAFCDEYRSVRVAIEFLVDHETPVTQDTVAAYFRDMGHHELADWLVAELPLQEDDGNLLAFAKKLADYHECQRSVQAMKNVLANLNTATDCADVLLRLQKVASTIGRVTQGRQAPLRIGTVMEGLLEDAERLAASGQVEGYVTGCAGIDEAFGRLKGGDLVVIAARPGMGKTELALKINKHIAQSVGCASLIVSLEMSHQQIGERLLSDTSQLPVDVFDNPDLLSLESIMDKLRRSAEEYQDLPIYLQEVTNATHVDVCSSVRQFAEEVSNLGLLTIDHVGLHKTIGTSRVEAVGDITRAYKMLARELGIPVLLLCQLNRNLEMRDDKRPMLSDLRESGAIEQDADRIVFIYRDSVYDDKSGWGSVAELINGKRRRGEAQSSYLDFKAGHFCDVPPGFTPPIAQIQAASASQRSFKTMRGLRTYDY